MKADTKKKVNTMNETISKIRAEIERLKGFYNPDDFYDQAYLESLADVESFLSTLESENPVPADLEEAAEKCIDDALFKWSYDDEDGIEQYVHDAFIAGAKWQKEQDDKMLEANWGEGFRRGKVVQKEQMLKDAVKWLVDDDYDELTEKGRFILGSVGIGYNGYYIPYSDLLKLPKEDEQ